MQTVRPDHIDLAISAAAEVVLDSTTKAVDRYQATARSLGAAILPAFGISWGRNVINPVTRGGINNPLLKLRHSTLSRLHYDKLAALFKTAFPNPYSLHPEWALWKQLADSFIPERLFSEEIIAQTITFLSARSVPDPGALAILDAGALETMAVDAPEAGPLRTIWGLSRTAAAVSSNEHLALPVDGLSAETFKKAVKRCQWSIL